MANGVDASTDTDLFLPMAVEGSLTTCGATLIAEQAATHALNKALRSGDKFPHDEQFLLKDGMGHALPDTYYTAKFPDGELTYGITDGDGRTERFGTDAPETIAIYLGHAETIDDAI